MSQASISTCLKYVRATQSGLLMRYRLWLTRETEALMKLGAKFRADADGYVLGVRFLQSACEYRGSYRKSLVQCWFRKPTLYRYFRK